MMSKGVNETLICPVCYHENLAPVPFDSADDDLDPMIDLFTIVCRRCGCEMNVSWDSFRRDWWLRSWVAPDQRPDQP
jgi:transcription elongation factor Elf1